MNNSRHDQEHGKLMEALDNFDKFVVDYKQDKRDSRYLDWATRGLIGLTAAVVGLDKIGGITIEPTAVASTVLAWLGFL